MIKKLVSMVKNLFKKVVAQEPSEEVVVVDEKAVVTKPNTFAERMESITRNFSVPSEPVVSEPIEEPRRKLNDPPQAMTWKQFKAYNNQVNSYLDRRLGSNVA